MNPPVVLPVVKPSGGDPKPHHPHLPKVGVDEEGGGSLLLLLSPVKTGKSTLISNLFLNDAFYGQEFFDEINVISNTIANDVTSRYLRKVANCHDHYSDIHIDKIVNRQKSFDKEDQPQIAICLDDCLGSIKRESKINHLCSRYRHFNIKLLIISSQKFRGAVSPVIRANATDVVIGSPFPNMKELQAISEEYGDLFGGADRWMKIYRKATPNKFDFLYMDLQSNPPLAYRNFEKVIAVGGMAQYLPDSDDDDDDDI